LFVSQQQREEFERIIAAPSGVGSASLSKSVATLESMSSTTTSFVLGHF
jgi:hypothetical protein